MTIEQLRKIQQRAEAQGHKEVSVSVEGLGMLLDRCERHEAALKWYAENAGGFLPPDYNQRDEGEVAREALREGKT